MLQFANQQRVLNKQATYLWHILHGKTTSSLILSIHASPQVVQCPFDNGCSLGATKSTGGDGGLGYERLELLGLESSMNFSPFRGGVWYGDSHSEWHFLRNDSLWVSRMQSWNENFINNYRLISLQGTWVQQFSNVADERRVWNCFQIILELRTVIIRYKTMCFTGKSRWLTPQTQLRCSLSSIDSLTPTQDRSNERAQVEQSILNASFIGLLQKQTRNVFLDYGSLWTHSWSNFFFLIKRLFVVGEAPGHLADMMFSYSKGRWSVGYQCGLYKGEYCSCI